MTPSGAGSVSVSPDRIDYVDDSVVELTATPDAGWSFTGWTGDASGTTNPLQVTVSADLEIGGDVRGGRPGVGVDVGGG